jgi:UDP-N-acetylmuramoyl-L-alanyl-D-glutamate--2,6-diaminopimelate ligase
MSTLSDLGYSDSEVARAASAFQPVSGRFEPVAGCRRVIVDYAHTPDALARILRDVRELDNSARLTVVFGCGGDRDSAKRPQMGAIAVSLADDVIVTSDNPRSEDPDAIIADVLSGVSDHSRVTRETDRRAAIALALTRANDNDIVVIAGKGHETTQDIGGVLTAFDDRVVAKEIMEELC